MAAQWRAKPVQAFATALGAATLTACDAEHVVEQWHYLGAKCTKMVQSEVRQAYSAFLHQLGDYRGVHGSGFRCAAPLHPGKAVQLRPWHAFCFASPYFFKRFSRRYLMAKTVADVMRW
jgi:hypothetical protein